MLKIIKTKGYKDSDLFAKAIIKRFEKEGLLCDVVDVDKDISVDKYFDIYKNDTESILFPLFPLPNNISKSHLSCVLTPNLDCIGELSKGIPITPDAIVRNLVYIVAEELWELKGKVITIINRTDRIGIPLSKRLSELGATVIICNSNTSQEDLQFLTSYSDIVITAMGDNSVINKEHINIRQIWIDCSNDVPKDCIEEIETFDGKYFGMKDVGQWTLDELVSRYKDALQLKLR